MGWVPRDEEPFVVILQDIHNGWPQFYGVQRV
jgi:hypothetical protein